MEKTYKRVPFDIELAKKIQSGEVEGRIVTKNGGEARILAFDSKAYFVESKTECYTTKDKGINKPLVVEYLDVNGDSTCYQVVNLLSNGKLVTWGDSDCDLIIELSEETPKHEFKPFDKVLVRDNPTQEWVCTLLSSVKDDGDYPIYLSICNYPWIECIPYEGNEHLVGTTKNPEQQ